MATFENGASHGTYIRKKVNTKSSTEGEQVGVNYVITKFIQKKIISAGTRIWSTQLNFVLRQPKFYIENTKRGSISKQTTNLGICYFFVTDKIFSNQINL